MVSEFNPSLGPEIENLDNNFSNLLQDMVGSMRSLKNSLENLGASIDHQTAPIELAGVEVNRDQAYQAYHSTRDWDRIQEQQKQDMKRLVHTNPTPVDPHQNRSKSKRPTPASEGFNPFGLITGGIDSITHQVHHHTPSSLKSGFQGIGVQNQHALNALDTLSTGVSDTMTSIIGVTGNFTQLTKSIMGLVAGVGGILTLGGLGGALSAIGEQDDVLRNTLKFSPTNFDSLTHSYHGWEHRRHQIEQIQHYTVGGKSKDRVNNYVNSMLGSRPSAGVTDNEIMLGSAYMGFAEDFGHSSDAVSSNLRTMSMELGYDTSSGLGVEKGLLMSALEKGVPDVNDYISNTIRMATSLKTLGVTVGQVDNTFSRFSKITFPSGTRIASDVASQSTEMALSLQKKLSQGMATVIALGTGSNLHALGSYGLSGSGMTLGQLAGSGLFGAFMASNYLRSGNVPGAYGAIAENYVEMARNKLPENLRDNQDALGFSLYDLLKSHGMVSNELSNSSVQALLKDMQTAKSDPKAEKRIRETFAKMSKDKTIPELLHELSHELMDGKHGSLGGLYEEHVKATNQFKAWEEIIAEIYNGLTNIFMPVIEGGMKVLMAIGEGLNYAAQNIQFVDNSAANNSGFGMAAWKTGKLGPTKDMDGVVGSVVNPFKFMSDFSKGYGSGAAKADKLFEDGKKLLGGHVEKQKNVLEKMTDALGLTGKGSLYENFQKGFSEVWNSGSQYYSNVLGDPAASTGNGSATIPGGVGGSQSANRKAYEPYAREMARKYGIPEDLFVRQIMAESNFNPNAHNPSGATGIAQIIPKWHPGVNTHDPKASLDYAAKLMSKNFNTYKKSSLNKSKTDEEAYKLSLAAYNWGPGAVAKNGLRNLPSETRGYISKITEGANWNSGGSLLAQTPNKKVINAQITVKNAKGQVLKTSKQTKVTG